MENIDKEILRDESKEIELLHFIKQLIIERTNIIMSTLADLQAAVTKITTDAATVAKDSADAISRVSADLAALKASVGTLSAADQATLDTSVASLTAAATSLEGSATSLTGLDPAAAAPAATTTGS